MPSPKGTVERLLALSVVWGAFTWMTNGAVMCVTRTPEIARESGPGMALGFLFLLIPLGIATFKILDNRNNPFSF